MNPSCLSSIFILIIFSLLKVSNQSEQIINIDHQMSKKYRGVSQIVNALEQSEGAGAKVRRSIGVISKRKFNPFLMFDHFSSAGNNGFPEHPHKGQETITLMLGGAMAHEDFTGSKGVLYSGDLQFMTAGKGVVHSEMPIPNKDGSPTVGLQLWVDLPKDLKNTEPRYRDLKEWEIPEVVEQDGKLRVKVISGKSYGVESLKDLAYTPIHYYYYKMKPGAKFEQHLDDGFNYFLYVLKGKNLILNESIKVNEYNNCFLEENGNTIAGENVAEEGSDNDIEFVLVGGKKLDQEVIQYGPFVANTREDIQQAFQDYQYGRNGFENIKTWRTLISGGVTESMINGPLGGNLDLREKARSEYLKAHSHASIPVKDEL